MSLPFIEKMYNELKIQEGTWLPQIGVYSESRPVVTYSVQNGTYKKIGKMVFIDFYIEAIITELKGTNNYAQIEGLPFRLSSKKYKSQNAIAIGQVYNLVETEENLTMILTENQIRIQTQNGASATKLKTSSNKCYLGGSGWYIVD